MNGKYVIVEIIPEAISPDKGSIVQLSALKINDLDLVDRFDYRLNPDKVMNTDVLKIVNYDNDSFKYVDRDLDMMNEFIKWIEDYTILIIDNIYTNNFLGNVLNKKESIVNYLDFKYSDDVIEKIITKYKLQPSNYIVDLLYEALMLEYK